MSEFTNGLSPEQTERLALLSEECGEVIQIIGKILRHGLKSYHPLTGISNPFYLEEEIGHLLFAIQLLQDNGDLRYDNVEDSITRKSISVGRYLHHSHNYKTELGELD